MRIGVVCHPTIGGSGLLATQLGIGMAKLGHQVHFISRTRPFKLSENCPNTFFHRVEGIDYPLFDDPLYTFALTAKIVEVVDAYNLDIVHAHYSIPHSLCVHLANEITKHKFPMITTIHGTDVTVVGRDKPLYPLNQFSINKSTTVTTVSRYQQQYIKKHFDIKKSIEVIYNFTNFDLFKASNANHSTRKQWADDDEKILMHISNFRPVKNTELVVKVFSQVVKSIKAKLVLVGTGPEVDLTKSLAARLNILDKVIFLGDINNVEQIIANADCVFQPSSHESFSLVLLEAMASGVPTVSSNVDGIPEVVQHGKTGFIAPLDDLIGMSDHIKNIFSDDVLSESMAKAGRIRAEQCFGWHQQVQKYLKCYENTLQTFHSNNVIQVGQ
ncbi:N-acetyl-alpha-D-glucosaminyl L-malate synthase BshA [Thalassotalea sp. ND16A]|uniref:N-acetyl-alpha-D-glucosaminyl L-malate synthase BshA n=1 Tax=Thalassotalea sp. ND16A TaxID=1535422 RepID=UPI00051DB3AB|nr:N-acetyl-alpha-D-glucosaminyl L-malate synthase BshA [Thalassotalea sp. ND16A]KGJ95780.1 hypothetical protein ND16A_1315 [Thalassotalea sp. ND16A]